MTGNMILVPIELTGAELDAVSGGHGGCGRGRGNFGRELGNSQTNNATATIIEQGGNITIDGGSNATSFTGNLTVIEVFNAAITIDQNNTG
jgi:hypothetical protein